MLETEKKTCQTTKPIETRERGGDRARTWELGEQAHTKETLDIAEECKRRNGRYWKLGRLGSRIITKGKWDTTKTGGV